MIKLYSCTKDSMKQHIDHEITQSPYKLWGGWIGAKPLQNKSDMVSVFYYARFPKKTWDLHSYLRIVKKEA